MRKVGLETVKARFAARARAAGGEPAPPATVDDAKRVFEMGQFERAAEKELVVLERERIENERLRAQNELLRMQAQAPPPPLDEGARAKRAIELGCELKLAELDAVEAVQDRLRAREDRLAAIVGREAARAYMDEEREMVGLDGGPILTMPPQGGARGK